MAWNVCNVCNWDGRLCRLPHASSVSFCIFLHFSFNFNIVSNLIVYNIVTILSPDRSVSSEFVVGADSWWRCLIAIRSVIELHGVTSRGWCTLGNNYSLYDDRLLGIDTTYRCTTCQSTTSYGIAINEEDVVHIWTVRDIIIVLARVPVIVHKFNISRSSQHTDRHLTDVYSSM